MLVRGLVTPVAALVIFAIASTACSDDGTAIEHTPTAASAAVPTSSTPPPAMFCESATAVLNQDMSVENYDGTWVLSQLRSIDTTDLPSTDKAWFEDTLASAERMIRLNGPDGWTTKGVSDASSRICGSPMTSWGVKP